MIIIITIPCVYCSFSLLCMQHTIQCEIHFDEKAGLGDAVDSCKVGGRFVRSTGDVCRSGCHIATGLRNDESIWFQCRRPLPVALPPTITWPIGRISLVTLLLLQLPSIFSHTLITVTRTWIELSIYGGTLNIIDSLKIDCLSKRFVDVFFLDTFLSFFNK